MDWNLWLCFVGVNFVLIQAIGDFNNVDSERLLKYLHRKDYQNPLRNGAQRKHPPVLRSFIVNTERGSKPIYYAEVDMNVVLGKPYVPSKKKPRTYHGNSKWSYLRLGGKHRSPKLPNHHDNSGEGKILKPAKRALVSYEEMSGKFDDAVNYKDDKKFNPGESLLQLNHNNLESAGNFPVTEKSSLVYGNLDNLGITHGKTNQRYEYSNFRKSNNLMDLFNTAIPKSPSGPKKWLVIEVIPRKRRDPFLETIKSVKKDDEENNASEILDEFDSDDNDETSYRRAKKKKSKFRKRDNYGSDWKSNKDASSSSTSSSSSETGSSNEKNPGNPFTLFKGKYRENWMWNHAMDGDHMNINPYGPLFNDMTAKGDDLLFARKWWYFNQDDYKPMG